MARIINVDEDTYIGYDFIAKHFYIGNKSTNTVRDTADKAKAVLDIVAPTNTVTLEQVQGLKTNPEPLSTISYTWSDKGDYVKTIQLNTYIDYPLEIDLISKKLFIKNSELIFDLTLNESAQYRTEYIASYYEKYIGFGDSIDASTGRVEDTLFKEQISLLYNFLVSFYSPTVYNQISEESISNAKSDSTSPLKYNNVFALSNYNEESPITYSCTLNPYSQYLPTPVATIAVMQADTGIVGLTGSVPQDLYVGEEVIIQNSSIPYLNTTYSNNGTYTIKEINNTDNTITLDQQLKMDYVFPYYEAYIGSNFIPISSSSYPNSTITLSATPSTNFYKVNSKISVRGSSVTVDNRVISIDGEYTIVNVSNNVLTVDPAPPYSIASTSVPDSSIYQTFKRTYLAPVATYNSSNNTITLMDSDNYISPLTTPCYIVLFTAGDTFISVQSLSNNSVQSDTGTILTLNALPSMEPYNYFPLLSLGANVDTVQVNTINTSSYYTFPTGTFNVDSFEQCQQYIATASIGDIHISDELLTKITPTQTIKNNIGQSLPANMTLTGLVDSTGTLIPMYSLGVFSMVYSS